jgi:oxygen-independent coproporphyrinogen-3 oxidase
MDGLVGLYVHFPYCAVRCNYCDFNTYLAEQIPAEEYTQAILSEGTARASEYSRWELATIYFGGGTPSLWGPAEVARVIRAAESWFPHRTERLEITMECNPGEAQSERLRAYREAGVNRLSLGVQSLSDDVLRRLNRRHDARAAREALDAALLAGFNSVSADLMFGLPGQSVDRFEQDLRTLAGTGVPHLSLYALTLEQGTAMTREVRAGRVVLPDEDETGDMWDLVDPVAGEYGLVRYEISNLALPGHHSRHNNAYWHGRPYLGLGAGAHSFLPPARWSDGARAVRCANIKHHQRYTRAAIANEPTVDFREELDRETHLLERVFTGIRDLRGLNLNRLDQSLGVDSRARYGAAMEHLRERGLLSVRDGVVRLTPEGLRLADTVAERLTA